MEADRLEAAQRVVQEVVRRWLRGKPWAAALAADLLQEATLAVLASEGNYRESLGAWEAYAAGAAHFAVQRYAWRYRGPVAPPRLERGGQRVAYVGGDEAEQALAALAAPAPAPDVAAATARARAAVRRVLRRLDGSARRAGLRVVLGEEPADVAARLGLPVRDVYNARRNLVRRAEACAELRQLAEELRP